MSNLKKLYFKSRNLLEDIVRIHLARPIGFCCIWASQCIPSSNLKFKLLMIGHRLTYSKTAEALVVKHLAFLSKHATNLIPESNNVWEHVNQSRNIVLKRPVINTDEEVTEKGILLIKFSTTFQYYLRNVDCKSLQKYFVLVLEPSWAGYCLPEILGWVELEDPIIIESSEPKDFNFIKNLNSNLVPVEFGSSDWVDHRLFHENKAEIPEFDSIYVSNFNSIKRNHVYLKALVEIRKRIPNFKAALVCNSWGETKDNLYALVDSYQLNDCLKVYEALSQTELNDLLANSKVNLLLSLKEGSNRSVFEALFTNTPAIVLKNNIGMNKRYITSETGLLVEEANLVDALEHFYHNWKQYNPRKWALNHIAVDKTKLKLDEQLSKIALQNGWNWTSGSELKVNTPEVAYFNSDLSKSYPNGMSIYEAFKLSNSPSSRHEKIKSLFYESKL